MEFPASLLAEADSQRTRLLAILDVLTSLCSTVHWIDPFFLSFFTHELWRI